MLAVCHGGASEANVARAERKWASYAQGSRKVHCEMDRLRIAPFIGAVPGAGPARVAGMRTTSRFTAATAAIAVLLSPLTACSNTDDAAPQPSSTVTPSARPEDGNAGIGHRFTLDPTIVEPHPLAFSSWTRLGDNTIGVNFQTGNPECFGVDVTVTETAEQVRVALRGGTRADAVGKMCTMNAVFGTVEITLDSPLGSREVVDAG